MVGYEKIKGINKNLAVKKLIANKLNKEGELLDYSNSLITSVC